MRGENIKATHFHDAGAIARCSYCGRYSDDPNALRDTDLLCDCGKARGWSGSFERPRSGSLWAGNNKIKLMFWGYLHANGTIQVKRWFGDHKDYTDDCKGNDFVQKVIKPFEAASREEAIDIIAKELSSTSDSRPVP